MDRTTRRPEPKLYTLGDLETRTGVPRRTLQGWGDAHVILAEGGAHGGRGVHRRFGRAELCIAALVAPLADAGWPIGHLARIGVVLRQSMGLAPGMFAATPEPVRDLPERLRLSTYEPGAFQIRAALTRAARSEGHNALLLAFAPDTIKVGVLEDNAGTAEFFHPDEDAEPLRMAICINLQPLAGVLQEVLSG